MSSASSLVSDWTDAAGVDVAIPADDTWRFGGIPFGLEPLFLPPRWIRPDESARTLPDDPERLPTGTAPEPEVLAGLVPSDGDEVDRLFWFRWITGHQVTFLLWQLLAGVMADVPDGSGAVRRARLYVRGYSQMLLYSSSCPRDVYGRVIRSTLFRQHPNLSGSWARDYRPVRDLLRGKVDVPGPAGSALAEECALNDRIHNGIATKLVPSGVSLLQSAQGHRGPAAGRDMLRALYDGTFLTMRASGTDWRAVVTQLVRRLQAVNLDVAANGLYPEWAPSRAEEPIELQEPPAVRCKAELPGTLAEIARTALTAGAPARLA